MCCPGFDDGVHVRGVTTCAGAWWVAGLGCCIWRSAWIRLAYRTKTPRGGRR
jgi:hypothetical protein